MPQVLCQHFILFNTPDIIMHYIHDHVLHFPRELKRVHYITNQSLSNYTIRTAICIIASPQTPPPRGEAWYTLFAHVRNIPSF